MEMDIIKRLRKEINLQSKIIVDLRKKIEALESKSININPTKEYFDLTSINSRKSARKSIMGGINIINSEIVDYRLKIKEFKCCLLEEDDHEDPVMLIYNNYYCFINEAQSIDQTLYYIDKYLFSREKTHVVRKYFGANIESERKLRERRNEINSTFTIVENKNYCFADLKCAIKNCLIKYLSKFKREELNELKKTPFQIRISGDGTNICKTVSVVNFVFTFLKEENCKSSSGTYTIGIAKFNEKYDDLKPACEYIDEIIGENKEFEYKEHLFKIEYFLGADLKFILEVNGLYSANSSYPCPFCTCHSDDLWKSGYSMFNTNHSRNREECNKILDKNTKQHLGYKRETLFKNISYDHNIADTLHSRLRIPGKLVKLLIKELAALDKYSGEQIINFEKDKNLTNWYLFLTKKLKINLRLQEYEKNKDFGITPDVGGTKLLKIFKKIQLEKLFPDLAYKYTKSWIWGEFYSIDRSISDNRLTSEELKTRTDNWLFNFLQVYPKDEVTPYMHIFRNHFYEILEKYGDLSKFTCQGIEKLNDETTREYFTCTNKKDDCLRQMLTRRLRIDKYESENIIQINMLNDNESESENESSVESDSDYY